ncbi:YodC family protein [Leeia aquatica]|nr:DUF2158 domain-containing protein [Leeia aquatica]
MAELKVGDVVQLKGGGPVMTIETIGINDSYGNYQGTCECSWFHNGERKKERFVMAALQHYEHPNVMGMG